MTATDGLIKGGTVLNGDHCSTINHYSNAIFNIRPEQSSRAGDEALRISISPITITVPDCLIEISSRIQGKGGIKKGVNTVTAGDVLGKVAATNNSAAVRMTRINAVTVADVLGEVGVGDGDTASSVSADADAAGVVIVSDVRTGNREVLDFNVMGGGASAQRVGVEDDIAGTGEGHVGGAGDGAVEGAGVACVGDDGVVGVDGDVVRHDREIRCECGRGSEERECEENRKARERREEGGPGVH